MEKSRYVRGAPQKTGSGGRGGEESCGPAGGAAEPAGAQNSATLHSFEGNGFKVKPPSREGESQKPLRSEPDLLLRRGSGSNLARCGADRYRAKTHSFPPPERLSAGPLSSGSRTGPDFLSPGVVVRAGRSPGCHALVGFRGGVPNRAQLEQRFTPEGEPGHVQNLKSPAGCSAPSREHT